MRCKIRGHLVNGYEWREWDEYERYIFEDEKVVNTYNAYRDTPSKDECDELCAALSGEVVEYYIKTPTRKDGGFGANRSRNKNIRTFDEEEGKKFK